MAGVPFAAPALAGAKQATAAPERGIVGALAPELTVAHWTGIDGAADPFSIQASRGRWVFLKCFQAWCPGCHSAGFPTLAAVQQAHGHHPDLALAAVQTVFEGFGSNTLDKIPEIRERYGLTMPIGHDAGDPKGERLPSTMRNYRTGGTPWLVLIDPAGRVVFDGFHVDSAKLIDWLGERLS